MQYLSNNIPIFKFFYINTLSLIDDIIITESYDREAFIDNSGEILDGKISWNIELFIEINALASYYWKEKDFEKNQKDQWVQQ